MEVHVVYFLESNLIFSGKCWGSQITRDFVAAKRLRHQRPEDVYFSRKADMQAMFDNGVQYYVKMSIGITFSMKATTTIALSDLEL